MCTAPYSDIVSGAIIESFQEGKAGIYTPEHMVRAGAFTYQPLIGGIHVRNAAVKNLIIHSTETARVATGKDIIRSWNARGLAHPGTQYVVDRDGVIYLTLDPKYASSHVNEKRTLKGVTNDNSIGIEIVRTGKQQYTKTQLASLVRLVSYIKDRFQIYKIYGHGQIQPSNRTDPVAFDWARFSQNLAMLRGESQTAYINRLAGPKG